MVPIMTYSEYSPLDGALEGIIAPASDKFLFLSPLHPLFPC